MTAPDPDRDRALESFAALLVALLVLTFARGVRADIVTEFGMGYKVPGTTSVLLLPECHLATIIETRPNTPGLNYRDASCGGDFPAFIGWPFAWEREYSDGIWKLRCGWFHYSNWFDGHSDRETHMDVAACVSTFNWSARKRRR